MAVLGRTFERIQTTPWPSLRLVPLLTAAGVIVVALALWQVAQSSDAATTSFTIQRLERERLQLQARVHALEAEVAYLSSLARIETEARGRLGLVKPERREIITIDVPPPEAQHPIPTRFLPDPEPSMDVPSAPWWKRVLDRINPFS